MSMLRRVEVVVLEEPMRLFRIVPERKASGFEDAFRSHYELGRPPRGPEDRAAAIHMALSMFDRKDVAVALAVRVPKLGEHIATMDLRPGVGICVAKTGGAAHWSVWGRPPQLLDCVADLENSR
jgi:hypothetical protein